MAKEVKKKKKTKSKKDTKIAQLKDLGPGIKVNDAMEKELKRLGISYKDLLKIKVKGSPGSSNKIGPVSL